MKKMLIWKMLYPVRYIKQLNGIMKENTKIKEICVGCHLCLNVSVFEGITPGGEV